MVTSTTTPSGIGLCEMCKQALPLWQTECGAKLCYACVWRMLEAAIAKKEREDA